MSAPIEPKDYEFGVKVVNIEDLRIARGKAKRPYSECRHLRQVYDPQERRVWCETCESEIEPFDAYMTLTEYLDRAVKRLQSEQKLLNQAINENIVSVASKVMDKEWRSRTTAPLCPHCSEAILPQDVAGGVARASRELVERARKRKQENQKPTGNQHA